MIISQALVNNSVPLLVIPDFEMVPKYLCSSGIIPVVKVSELQHYSITKERLIFIWFNNPRLENELIKKLKYPRNIKIIRHTLTLSNYAETKSKEDLMELIDETSFYSDSSSEMHRYNKHLVFVVDRAKVIYFQSATKWSQHTSREASTALSKFDLIRDWLEWDGKFMVNSIKNAEESHAEILPEKEQCQNLYVDRTGCLYVIGETVEGRFNSIIMNHPQMVKYGYLMYYQIRSLAINDSEYADWKLLMKDMASDAGGYIFDVKPYEKNNRIWCRPFSPIFGNFEIPSTDPSKIDQKETIRLAKSRGEWIMKKHRIKKRKVKTMDLSGR